MAGVILILRQPAIILGSFFSSIRIVYIIYTLIYTILLVGIGGFVYVYLMIVLGGIRRMDIESLSPKVYGTLLLYKNTERRCISSLCILKFKLPQTLSNIKTIKML